VYAVEIAVPWSAVAVPSYHVRSIHSPARHLTVTASVLLSFRPASDAALRNNAVMQIAFFLQIQQGDKRLLKLLHSTRVEFVQCKAGMWQTVALRSGAMA
jgi:hypothetical protein